MRSCIEAQAPQAPPNQTYAQLARQLLRTSSARTMRRTALDSRFAKSSASPPARPSSKIAPGLDYLRRSQIRGARGRIPDLSDAITQFGHGHVHTSRAGIDYKIHMSWSSASTLRPATMKYSLLGTKNAMLSWQNGHKDGLANAKLPP